MVKYNYKGSVFFYLPGGLRDGLNNSYSIEYIRISGRLGEFRSFYTSEYLSRFPRQYVTKEWARFIEELKGILHD